MKIDLNGRTALITGSTDGIGYAAARGLAAAGANVVINGRHEKKTRDAANAIATDFPAINVTAAAADLSSKAGVEALIAGSPAEIDILVNNVAVNIFNDVMDADEDVYFHLFELNFMSGVRLTRHFLPGMLARDKGRVIFCGSETALRPSADMMAYAASKTAQLGLARAFAERARATNVTVNTIMVGPTNTAGPRELHKRLAAESGKTIPEIQQDYIDTFVPHSLLGRMAEAEEVANFIVYLASDQATATRGAILSAEGGVRQAIFV